MSYLIICPHCGQTVCECKELSCMEPESQYPSCCNKAEGTDGYEMFRTMCPVCGGADGTGTAEDRRPACQEPGMPDDICRFNCCRPENPCCEYPPCPEPGPGACPESGICNRIYGQYGLSGNAPTGSFIEFYQIAAAGEAIVLQGSNELKLAAGYVYYISYVALCTPETNSYFQIVPQLDGTPRLNYGTFAVTNGIWRNASAASSFLVAETLEREVSLQLKLHYSGNTRNIDLSGGITIFPAAVA